MMTLTIERLTPPIAPADEGDILALEAATEERPLGAASLLAEAVREDGVLLVARSRSTANDDDAQEGVAVVGFASARLLVDEAHVLRVTVAAPWRRQGVGARLLDGLVDWARVAGALAVVLEVRERNEAAHALYARAGFVADGRRANYYPGGEAALLLRHALPVSPAADEGRR
jgi:ribosomal protein S18 acetylase RimI-like enzyme